MGPVALITGVSSGIGRATAHSLARDGFRLVLGSRDRAAGEALVASLPTEARFLATDVREPLAVQALVTLALEAFGRLDAAVNNAGVESRGPIEGFSEAEYQRVFDTNVLGLLRAMKAELPELRKTRGAMVNVSSTTGSRGLPGMALYAASKHAVEGASRVAALEVAEAGVRVNVVAPGPIDTPMLARVTEGDLARLSGRVPLKRAGTPEEVADVIAWLVSPRASFVTGSVVRADGGLAAT
jgi:NAD(P)-dependent dehydrogenase (short-subunit alcohol dehydrogenase family)